jgi:SOS-response transcriptional repressor LexA
MNTEVTHPGLSTRQENLLKAICNFWKAHGKAPTIRELIDRTDFTSTSVVNYNLNILEREGLIERRERSQPRNICPVLEPRAVCSACFRELSVVIGQTGLKVICPVHGAIHQGVK